jgi:zinc/manganese transport system ATP-binding protein
VGLGRLVAARPGCCDVEAALQRVGLAGLAQRRLDQLSGGQQQRALLARTLVQPAQVLLLDEPCAAIDPPARTALLQVMGQLRDAGLTLLVSSHDWGHDLDAYDRVLVLDRQLLADGSPQQVRRALGDLRWATTAAVRQSGGPRPSANPCLWIPGGPYPWPWPC